MGVIPEEADGSADHRSAEDGDLADHGHTLQLEVVGKDDVAADIGEHGERAGGDDGAADGEPVQAVRQVDGVAGTHEHKHDEDDERDEREPVHMRDDAHPVPDKVWTEVFGERNDQARGVKAATFKRDQSHSDARADGELAGKFLTPGEALVMFVHDLDVIVGEAYGAERQGGEHDDPDEGV